MPIQNYAVRRALVRAIKLVTKEDAEEIVTWVSKGARMHGEVRPWPVARRGPMSLSIPTPMGMERVEEGYFVVEVDPKVFFALHPDEFDEEYVRIN